MAITELAVRGGLFAEQRASSFQPTPKVQNPPIPIDPLRKRGRAAITGASGEV